MSITDELRKWARNRAFVLNDPLFAERVNTYADNIDAAHERETREQYDKGHDVGFDEGFASADDWNADHAEELAEHGWVKLPVDADGEVIHIGDKIDVYQTKNVEVVGVGDQVVFTHYYMGDYFKHFAGDCHHHEPTVEDVLQDACKAYHSLMVESTSDVAHDMPAPSEVIAEYVDRIREAVEHE